MLRISQAVTSDEKAVLLRLEGQVSGRWVEELRRACGEYQGNVHQSELSLDLAEVSFIDADGVALFRELTARRVRLTNCSPFAAEQLKGVAHGHR
jgi:anti-anti-sigma regulatory factor